LLRGTPKNREATSAQSSVMAWHFSVTWLTIRPGMVLNARHFSRSALQSGAGLVARENTDAW
jgi:hypothetical protein